MKVKIEDIKLSYYDDKDDTIHFRRSLFSESEDKIIEVLEEEIRHAVFKRKWLNILWDWRRVIALSIFAVVITWIIYFSAFHECRSDLGICMNMTRFASNIILPKNFTPNFTS